MNSIMREIEDIKKAQMELLEVENTIFEKQIVNKIHHPVDIRAHFQAK